MSSLLNDGTEQKSHCATKAELHAVAGAMRGFDTVFNAPTSQK